MAVVTFRLFSCDRCGDLVEICRPCDRGNRYCGPECSAKSRAETKRRASKRYQETPAGRENHRQRQTRYLIRRSNSTSDESVTHQGSPPEPFSVSVSPQIVDQPSWVAAGDSPSSENRACSSSSRRCCWCGRPAADYLRFTFKGGTDPG